MAENMTRRLMGRWSTWHGSHDEDVWFLWFFLAAKDFHSSLASMAEDIQADVIIRVEYPC